MHQDRRKYIKIVENTSILQYHTNLLVARCEPAAVEGSTLQGPQRFVAHASCMAVLVRARQGTALIRCRGHGSPLAVSWQGHRIAMTVSWKDEKINENQ